MLKLLLFQADYIMQISSLLSVQAKSEAYVLGSFFAQNSATITNL